MKIRKPVLDTFRCFELLKPELGERINLLIGDKAENGITNIIK